MKGILFFLLIFLFIDPVKSQEIAKTERQAINNIHSVKNESLIKNYYSGYKDFYSNASPKAAASEFFSKLYFKFYGGYGFLTPGSYSVQTNNNITYFDQNGDQHDTTIQSQGKKGIGGGLRFGGGIGYVLNDFLNLGIDAEYLFGTKLTNSLITSIDAYNYNSTSDKMNYKAVTLTPYIIFKALAKPKYFIYNKLGILFTLPYTLNTSGNSVSTWTYNWPPANMDSSFKTHAITNSEYDRSYKISLGIGFNVAFGVNFRVNNKIRAFAELFGNFSPLYPSSSQINFISKHLDSSYTDNQLSVQKNIDYSTTNTTYQKEGLTIQNQTSLTMLPPSSDGYFAERRTWVARDQKFTVNMNVMGINVGFVYRF